MGSDLCELLVPFTFRSRGNRMLSHFNISHQVVCRAKSN